jgi:hypothetical protein
MSERIEKIKDHIRAQVMHERVEKIKQHFRDHKVAYSCGATAIVTAGITVVVMRGRYAGLGNAGPDGRTDSSVTVRPISFFSTKQSTTTNTCQQTISIYGNRLGRPGKPVYDTTTGKRYESETLAAKAVGVSKDSMTRHLNGKFPNLFGHIFIRILEEFPQE